MQRPFCRLEQRDGVLLVRMDNPQKLNALVAHAHEEMAGIFRAFDVDPSLRVAILTGEGKAFCAGADIAAYVAGTNRPLPPEGGGGLTHNYALTKPVIAAVNGLCMGGGFEIALACDIMVADPRAVFSLPEPLIGASALGGGLARLVKKLPPSRAMALALTGDRLSAADAFHFGLVAELSPEGGVVETAMAMARRIMACSPVSLRITRAIMKLAVEGADQATIDKVEAELRAEQMSSADFREGTAAFIEKRPPRWTGQ